MKNRALIIGASGIAGSNLADRLIEAGWGVYGLSRGRTQVSPAVQPIIADLASAESVRAALHSLDVTHVFFTAWARQATELENIRVNGAMVSNVLDALEAGPSKLEHVALVTGLKHYLGPFEAYATGAVPQTPFREEQGRQNVDNFYYEQEDRVFAAAQRQGFTWSVHRPHTIIGFAVGNAMNMGTTLAVYATLCKQAGLPFVFPGSATQWNSLTDRLASWWHSDADLGRPMEVLTDMSKSRKAGFLDFQATDEAFFDLFGRLKAQRIIPA
jgi:nucleoside-diphosphate-sugar epimerase